jgi:Protein of unknown function (DUF1116)
VTITGDMNATRNANGVALRSLFGSRPMLVDVRPAIEALPGLTRTTVLTSGPPMPWPAYTGGQRAAVLGGVVHEGLAATFAEADDLLARGDVRVAGCQDFECVGSVAGVTTASMPVLVVQDAGSGHRGHCTLYEGESPARLNYGVYDDSVERNLQHLATVIGPALGQAVRGVPGGLPLLPIMQRALRQGDELHSRHAAASSLFLRELVPTLLELDRETSRVLVRYLTDGDYFFLRPAMAAAKAMAGRMTGVAASSVVTAMSFSCREFGIRVSGLGERWFRGPLPTLETCQLFAGRTVEEIELMGGESIITEVCGLGGFAQAAAFALQAYQGGGPEAMINRNLEMYEITAGEHSLFTIPFLRHRGTPAGIDVHRVAATRIAPALDIGIAAKGGGQIGAGSYRAPLEPFIAASEALTLNG